MVVRHLGWTREATELDNQRARILWRIRTRRVS